MKEFAAQAAPRPIRGDSAFTLIEALVAMALTSVILAMIVTQVLSMQKGYFTDVARTTINSNLRSAMDIISMNIRQAGENLPAGFPAVVATNGSDSTSDTLTLRRSLVPEVLTLCSPVASGASSLFVSSTTLSNSRCVGSNVAPTYTVFETWRTANEGTLPVYLYDRSRNTGEFVTYSGSSTDSGRYELVVSGLDDTYPAITTSIYILEEYAFDFDASDSVLRVVVDGDTEDPRPVAFSVAGLSVRLEMEDGTTQTSLEPGGSYTWKDLEQIEVTLTGEESYRTRTVTSSITSKFFPRNVMSYDG